jgi:hypothetical protein
LAAARMKIIYERAGATDKRMAVDTDE